VPESPLLQFSSAGIDKSNLLETRIMLAPFCWALVGLHHQVYRAWEPTLLWNHFAN
jgi:hypothetical protein